MAHENRRSDTRSRRRVLASIATSGALATAGCVDGNDDSSGADDDQPPNGSDQPPIGGDQPPDDGDQPADDTWAEGGPTDRERWTVAFQDDFSGGELDREAWTLGAGYDILCAGSSLECWSEENVWVDAEADRLVLRTTDRPTGDREYGAAGIATRGSFEQEFGYFEAKARPPAEPGGLPAFWAWWNADDWTYRREIDFYEVPGASARTLEHNVHVDCSPRPTGGEPNVWRGGESDLDQPVDDAFRVYACEWTPEAVRFFVDGELRLEVADDVIGECLAGEPMWLVLSSHVNDDMGDPTAATYPYRHEFEWVRAWQRAERS